MDHERFHEENSNKSRSYYHTSLNTVQLIELTPQQQKRLEKFLEKKLKSLNTSVGLTDFTTHVIELLDTTPIKQKPYRRCSAVKKSVDKEIDRYLEKGFIIRSKSAWASPIVVVLRKNGKIRICVDYRKFNRITKKFAYPLPRMDTILDALTDAVIISTIDLTDAFNQIPMDPESRPYTAFVVPGRGLFEWVRMPFGLTNAPATFQAFTDRLKEKFIDHLRENNLPEYYANQIHAYLDDWIVIWKSFEEHLQLLEILFEVLQKNGLTINTEKSHYAKSSVEYLGFLLDKDSLRPNPERIEPLLNFLRPQNRKELRRFNGSVNWYHRHLRNIAKIQGPLNKLASPKAPWNWTEEYETSFLSVKEALKGALTRSAPTDSLPFILYTDASNTGIGAILMQKDNDREYRITCVSRPLRGAELNYITTEKECLAVVDSVRKLRCYLETTEFTVVTDHARLLWLYSLKNPVGRLDRWAMELLSYNVTIEHKKRIDK